jgi:hypothetical protein
MTTPTLLSDPTCLRLKLLDASEATFTAMVTTTSEETEWALCHLHSAQIHSRYIRQVANLLWMGCAVRLAGSLKGSSPPIHQLCGRASSFEGVL